MNGWYKARILCAVLCVCMALPICAQEDSVYSVEKRKKTFLERLIEHFTTTDTTYIEPQKYNLTFMLQNTRTVESYSFANSDGQSVSFSPHSAFKLGPYFGYRWIFLGYTFDLNRLSSKNRKTEIDFSFYAPQVGLDVFYRDLGNKYKISNLYLGHEIDVSELVSRSFTGLSGRMYGMNAYYIFNHKRFSYPAAFSQSTVQRRSVGSFMMGAGYMRQSLNMDWAELDRMIAGTVPDRKIQSLDSLYSDRVNYTDVSISAGYGYNWVPLPNFLVAASLSLALGYKHSWADDKSNRNILNGFSLNNIGLDGIGRFGLVYNNMRWYIGISAVMHTYNYHKRQFSTNTTFGNINIYVGFNFWRKK